MFRCHTEKKHGFCCGRCKNKGEGQHGGACQHLEMAIAQAAMGIQDKLMNDEQL